MHPIEKQITEMPVPLSEAEARSITDQIKGSMEVLWAMIFVAHERGVHLALGYGTWANYVKAEFDIGRSQSYRLLDQARVIHEINLAATSALPDSSVSPFGDIRVTEIEARQLKPILSQVTERIREEVKNMPPERVQEIVAEVIHEERASIQKAAAFAQGREDLQKLAKELGWKPDPQACKVEDARVNLMYGLYNAIEEIAELPPPDTLAQNVQPYERQYVDMIPRVIEWLGKFAEVAR